MSIFNRLEIGKSYQGTPSSVCDEQGRLHDIPDSIISGFLIYWYYYHSGGTSPLGLWMPREKPIGADGKFPVVSMGK